MGCGWNLCISGMSIWFASVRVDWCAWLCWCARLYDSTKKRSLWSSFFWIRFRKLCAQSKGIHGTIAAKRDAKIHNIYKVTVTKNFSDVQNDYRNIRCYTFAFKCVIVVNLIPEPLHFVHLTIYTNFKLTNLVGARSKMLIWFGST